MLYDPMNCTIDIWCFQECDEIPRRKPPKNKRNLDKCGMIVRVGDRYYCPNPECDDTKEQIRRAIYCYAIGDDLYEAADGEVISGSEIVSSGVQVTMLRIHGGKIL